MTKPALNPTRGAPTVRVWLLCCLAAVLPAGMDVLTAQETPARKAPTLEELFGDPVIARANGVEIHQAELDKAFLAYLSNLAARGQQFDDSRRTRSEALLLDRMIVTHVLTNRATRIDQRIAAANAEKFLARTREDAGADDTFERQLKLTGMTVEQFNQRIYEQSLAEAVVERELKSTLEVSEAEIQAFYDDGTDLRVRLMLEEQARLAKDPAVAESERLEFAAQIARARENNQASMMSPETVKVAHILRSVLDPENRIPLPKDQRDAQKNQAEALLQQARQGADFLELVKTHSQDRNLPETEGIYTMTREDRFAPEFLAASFSLEQGQISDVVETRFGYHVIKCLEKRQPYKRPLAEITERLHTFLLEQKLQRAMPDYFRKLKQEAKVEILDKKYRDALPQDATGFGSDVQ